MGARKYGYCAKCLKPKAPSARTRIHEECRGPGMYNGCAACGKAWVDQPNRNWVCNDCLAHQVSWT